MLKFLFTFFSLFTFGDDNRCEDFLLNLPQFQYASDFEDEMYPSVDNSEFYTNFRKLNMNIDFNDYDQHLLNAALFYLTNEYRIKKKLPPLKFEKRLRNASFIHASEMMNKNFFNHVNPINPEFKNPKDRCAFCNYTYKASAENIARVTMGIETQITYFQMAKKILDNLTSSPVHLENIISKTYTELGCTIMISTKTFKGGEKDFYAVQDFGIPQMESLDLEGR